MTEEAEALLAALQAIADGSFYRQSDYSFRTPSDYAVAELARLGYQRVWRTDGTQWVWGKGEPIVVARTV
jgi:hypothetical protein